MHAQTLYSPLDVTTLLSPERRSTRKDVEIHHLFPKAWLKANGVTSRRDYNQVANQTLVEWSDTADIGARSPQEYGLEYENKIPEVSRAANLADHALPDRWWEMKYPDFIDIRRKLMADVIRRSFESMAENG